MKFLFQYLKLFLGLWLRNRSDLRFFSTQISHIFNICKYTVVDMDSKRIYTRAHLDPNPLEIVENCEKIIRKKSATKSESSESPLPRVNSVSENFLTLEDI